MDRRNLIKNACGAGFCGCMLAGMLNPANVLADDETKQAPPEDWRLGFVKGRYNNLMKLLYEQLGPEEFSKTIQKMGMACSANSKTIKGFEGDIDKYVDFMKNSWHEDITYDKENGVITVIGSERPDCFCPLIDTKKTPAYVCDCSIGWQKQTYKTVLGKDVEVEILESVLRGGKRCAMKIAIKGDAKT